MKSVLSALTAWLPEALFGKYLGIQVFLAPITMFYLIESNSILKAGTSLLSFRIHFLPLLVFLIMLAFMLFMLAKLRLINCGNSGDYLESVVQLNISILALVLIALITYAMTGFLSYFYGIKGTLKDSMYLLFKFFTTIIILYHYLLNHLLDAFYQKRYSRRRAIKHLKAWANRHRFLFLRYCLFIILLIVAITRIYILAIHYLLVPVFTGLRDYAGFDLRFSLVQFYGLSDVFINVAVLLVAFLISNLIIYPIVYLFESMILRYLPINVIIGKDHAQTTQ